MGVDPHTEEDETAMPHARSRPHRRWALLIAAGLTLWLAAPATAGTYDVYACDGAHAGGASPSWGGAADAGFATYSACPSGEGIVARSAWDNGYSSWLQGGYQIFDAPPGTTVDSLHAYIRLSRPSCDWGVGVVGGNADLTGTTLYYLAAGRCGIDGMDWLWRDIAVNAPRVRVEARCGAASCFRGQAYSGGSGVAEAELRDVRVTIRDDAPPALANGGGSLITSGGWVAGMQSVSFDASDPTGIQLAGVDIDGRRINGDTKACDYTQRVPCPNGGYAGLVDTSTIRPDGPHSLTLEAIDAAGNQGTSSRTILVDNTAPVTVKNLSLDGGETWRNANQFAVLWQNPTPDGGAPIAGAEYLLCKASGGSCVRGSRTGDRLSSITDLKVPAAGDWTLQLWPRDAAGNEDSRNAAPPVHLKFDESAPDVALQPGDPNDPTLVAATASDAVSGVAQAQVELRRQGSDSWQALPTSYDGQRMTARIDDEALSKGTYELRAHAVDAAGNERTTQTLADGQPATVTLPLRLGTRFVRAGLRHGRLAKTSMAHRVRVRYGRAVRIRGRVATAQGNPVPEVDVLVFSRARRLNAPTHLVATLKTSRRGGFTYRAPKGVSRTIEFRYGGTPTIQQATQDVQLLVRAGSTMHASRHVVLNGETVRFHGRLRGHSIPPGGKLVELQVILRGQWHTFGTTHTGARGRWHYDYRFDGTRGRQTYHFRVRVPREVDYPFETGHSRPITVKVRGL